MLRRRAVLLLLVVFDAGAENMRPIPPEKEGAPLEDVVVAAYRAVLAHYEGRRDKLIVHQADELPKFKPISGNCLAPSRDRYYLLELPKPDLLSTDRYQYPRYFDLKQHFDPDKPIPPLDDEIVFIMRIHALSGELLKTIPIEGAYAAMFLTGRWINDRWIVLTVEKRGRFLYDLLVDTQTDRKFLTRSGGNVLTTTDGADLIWGHGSFLYHDFRSIYPEQGHPLLNLGDRQSWEAYRRRHHVQKSPTPDERMKDQYTYITRYEMSPDGKELVVLDMRTYGPQVRKTRKIEPEKIPADAPSPRLVFIDLEKMKAGKPLTEYTRTIDLPKEEKLRLRKRDSGRLIVTGKDGRTAVWESPPPAPAGR